MSAENDLSDEEFLGQTDNHYPVLLPGGLTAFKMLIFRLNRPDSVILSLARDQEQLLTAIESQILKGQWVALLDC